MNKQDNSYTIEHQYDLFESTIKGLNEAILISNSETDIYVEILKILEQNLPQKETANLIKKLFDKYNDSMIQLIMKIAKES